LKKTDVVNLIQISDCHLGSKKGFVSNGVNTYDSFKKVLCEIKKKFGSSLIIISGDISASGAKASYQLFSDTMDKECISYRWLPGNHDDLHLMSNIISQQFIRVEKHENWVIVSLISSYSKNVEGFLAKNEIEELEFLLKKYKDRYILLFVHHPPAPINSKWLDEHRITNSGKLKTILSGHPNVKGIFTGHVHQERATDWGNSIVYSTPSTCYQFVKDIDYFEISSDGPSYRWIDLKSDGVIVTGVNYLKS
jgi:Icc protein